MCVDSRLVRERRDCLVEAFTVPVGVGVVAYGQKRCAASVTMSVMEKCLKTGNGSEFLTGNQLIFQNFQGFTRFVAKSCKILPQETEMGSRNA